MLRKIQSHSKLNLSDCYRAAKGSLVNKNYVRKLEDLLNSEKEARKKLESEVEEMRKIN